MVLGGLSPMAQAQTGLNIQLVPETTAIVPGQPFRIGLYLQPQAGWHTYWRQPGIVGVPTSIQWQLPEGFTAGELEYPEPDSIFMFRIKAQGFKRDVLLQTVITPPSNLPLGKSVLIHGKATWMCCGDSCHPGQKELSLTLPVAATSSTHVQWQPLFEKARQAYPQSSTVWTTQASEDGLKVTLVVRPKEGARSFTADEKIIFFTEDGWINTDEPQPQELAADGSLTIHLTRADVYLGKTVPDQLHGLLQREGGWEPGATWRSLTIAPNLHRDATKTEAKK
jgi:DsbC/DsbD-like thiol-disulfide interchange protein